MTFFHRHKWKVTGAEHMMMVTQFAHSLGGKGTPMTEVLMVCECLKVRTERLTGHWTLAQLQPAPTQAEADKEFFKKLGVAI